MASTSCSLLRLQPGSTGSIHKIEGMNPILRRRLADLGVSEGVNIRLKGKRTFLGACYTGVQRPAVCHSAEGSLPD